MGASRKLQGEIDRVLKKVQEGVEVFDQIWNKVYETDNVNQKEKFEADLKKEIKKLQRYRDQIKTWIQSSEIKDKKALMDARKVIELRMERFKICEKETKTKAFSKEGLGQQPKTDPKEKAKSETRDWLNNVVSELDSQIDSFEAEIEGISFKKGKTRPPRLAHLETSIVRHKAHIVKLELILRLLDNDELSPEQVNDVKDFLDDYVERNQDDFDEFSDVDDLYTSLPLDKVELEDLVTTGPLVKGAQIHSLKPSLAAATQVNDQGEETASRDGNSDVVKSPPPKGSGPAPASSLVGHHATSATATSTHNLPGVSSAAPILPSSGSVRGALDNAISTNPLSPSKMAASTKENEIPSFSGSQSSPSASDSALVRGIGRGSLSSNPLSPANAVSNSGNLGGPSLGADITKRNISGNDDRTGSVPLTSPRANRTNIPQVSKAGDGTSSVDSNSVGDSAPQTGRMFSPAAPGMQWNPSSPFTIQNETTQFPGRTEIAPDQREKFLQRFQQVQQGQTNILGMPLTGGNLKQLSGQQQSPLLQQFNSQNPPVSSHAGLGIGGLPPGINSITSGTSQQQPNSVLLQAGEHGFMPSVPKDIEPIHARIEEQQQEQKKIDESTIDAASASGPGMNIIHDGDSKHPYASDSHAGESGSLTTVQHPKDTDLSPGQPLQSSQPSIGLGVIGRRSDIGAVGDNPSGSITTPGAMQDQLNNLQMLEAAYFKLPHPKDSERARSYNPRTPAITPPSYPQSQAAIVNNPVFWERLGADNYATDTLFFAFYYQQNSYQQYLAARELKKQSWRFHKKYNTWFQRHEEPKIATDEFEQGTYVYFDFHIGNDDSQPGWCQRIKTEFTFEYNYLEDELV